MTYESLASLPESELVRRLLKDSHWRDRILRLHGIPDGVSYFPEVELKGLGAEGDVDILAVNPATPKLATGIQVKRIRVSKTSFEPNGSPNKLQAISKLNRQASLLVDLGFWQVFAFVFVVVDSRVRNIGEYRFDGLTSELRMKIAQGVTMNGLATRAGCIVYELTQPMEDDPLSTGTYGGHIHRMPTCSPQSSAVTNWVMSNTQIAGG